MANYPLLFDQNEQDLYKIYEEVFRTLVNHNDWENVSVEIDESTPDEVIQKLEDPDRVHRGRDYLFKYTDSSFSEALLELRIPSVKTGDILIGGLSYKANSRSLNQELSLDIYERTNKTIIRQLIDADEGFFTLDKPGEEFPNSDLLWIRISPKVIDEVKFNDILQRLGQMISVTDDFYSKIFPDILLSEAHKFAEEQL